MKKINIILVIFFLILFSNQSNSENHNQVSLELDRIKNDIIDLQKFVYKNESSLSNNVKKIVYAYCCGFFPCFMCCY